MHLLKKQFISFDKPYEIYTISHEFLKFLLDQNAVTEVRTTIFPKIIDNTYKNFLFKLYELFYDKLIQLRVTALR